MRILFGVGVFLVSALASLVEGQGLDFGGGMAPPTDNAAKPTAPPSITRPTRAPPITKEEIAPDPCLKKKCGVGEECKRKDSDKSVAECVCISNCIDKEFPDPLCSNANVSFTSTCEFERRQCQCGNKVTNGCKAQPGTYIIYYAECQGMDCRKEFDMVDYGNRLAQWFRVTHGARAMIPQDSVSNNDDLMRPLSKKDTGISAVMYNDPNGNSIYVSWWFCDLDRNNDGSIDRKELAVLTRALLPNEPCVQTFLSGCDADSSKKITPTEWHGPKCFNITSKKAKSCANIYKLDSYLN